MDELRTTTAWVVEHGSVRYLRETEDEARGAAIAAMLRGD